MAKMSKAQAAKVAKVMKEYKEGKLHAGVDPEGPKRAPMARSRRQAIAIALSEARVARRR